MSLGDDVKKVREAMTSPPKKPVRFSSKEEEQKMSIMITGDKIPFARILTLRKMLHLEIQGLKRRGRSAYAIIKEEFGFKGNKQRVYEQLDAWIEEHDYGQK